MVLRPSRSPTPSMRWRRPGRLRPGSCSTRVGEGSTRHLARDLAARAVARLCGPRYEGVDERVRSLFDLELSIGDYILSGGELPALVVIDAVLRLLPGAIDDASPVEESFSEPLLEYPQYTRPAEFRGDAVPDVLVSGHHAEVARWRASMSIERTRRLIVRTSSRQPGAGEPGSACYTPGPPAQPLRIRVGVRLRPRTRVSVHRERSRRHRRRSDP